MKKLFMALALGFITVQSYAIGIEFSFKKGVREWAPDGHSADCIGSKKLCEFKIKVDFPLSMSAVPSLDGGIGGIFNDNGQVTIGFPATILNDEAYNEIFENGSLVISDDYVLTDEEKQALGGGAPDVIPAGAYPYTINDEGALIVSIQ